jgi:hypothetical protein
LTTTHYSPNSDDEDGFFDIDELLAGLQQKSISASAKPNCGGTAENVDNRTRIGSPVDSIRSTKGSTQGKHIASLSLVRYSYSFT